MIYTEDEIKKKKSEYEDLSGKSPDAFSSRYETERLAALNKIANGEDFSYDPASDPLYGSYKESYINDGERAMRDTMANAMSLTGGRLNSYAVSAGQGAYNEYLRSADRIIPELYELALKRYNANLDRDKAVYDMYSGLYDDEYREYGDSVDNYYKKLSALRTAYSEAYDTLADERDYELSLLKQNAKETAAKDGTSGENEDFNTQSENIKKFRSSVLTKSEFRNSPMKIIYADYASYLKSMVSQWHREKKITDKERNYLLKEVNYI